MPLDPTAINKLYEIYELNQGESTVVTGGDGSSPVPTMFDLQLGVKERLIQALADINADDSKVARVEEILAAYDDLALDFSTIDRSGYSFRPGRNLQRLRTVLYPYTGILWQNHSNNRMSLG